MPLAPPPTIGQDVSSKEYRDWFYSIYSLLGKPGATLGSMAYQNANSVAITGGAIGGVGITGSNINSTPIGQITPSLGSFTNLSANGTVSGVGFTNLFASPPAIGNVTPNTGKFTTLTLTNPLTAPNGGTGFGSYAVGDILYANSTSTLTRLASPGAGSPSYLGTDGTGIPQWIQPAYGSFTDNTTQSVATINTPQKVNIAGTDMASGMSMTSSRITVTKAGTYNVQFSVQSTNSDTQAHDFDIWIKKNGTDVPASASVATVQGTHGGQPGYNITAANFFIQFATSDYIEFWWAANSTLVSLNTLPAITTPFTSPSAPSIVVTLTQLI